MNVSLINAMQTRTPQVIKDIWHAINGDLKTKRILRQKHCIEQACLSKVDPWMIDRLSLPLQHYCPATKNWWGGRYGHESILKQYVDLPDDFILDAGIQHGFTTPEHETDASTYPEYEQSCTAFVWGDAMKNCITRRGKNVITIGAPFFYLPNITDKEAFLVRKRELGKVLFAMPIHQGGHDAIIFDIKKFSDDIVNIKNKYYFDTVLVSLVMMGKRWPADLEYYRAHNFQCVSCGQIYDSNYLKRLDFLISLSDAVVINNIGSCFGYSLFRKKPLFFIKTKLVPPDSSQIPVAESQNLCFSAVLNFLQCTIDDLFPNNMQLNEYQIKMNNHYWGANRVKGPNELLQIIQNLN